jgi:hypothetical protein
MIIIIIIIITYDYNSQCKAERSVMQGYQLSLGPISFTRLQVLREYITAKHFDSNTNRSTRSSPGTCRVPTARALGLSCHPNSNSLIRIPFRTETNTHKRKRKQKNTMSLSRFALRAALGAAFVWFSCFSVTVLWFTNYKSWLIRGKVLFKSVLCYIA